MDVVFLAYDGRLGLTLHFLDWIESLARLADDDIVLHVITLFREQNPGLIKTLKAIPVEVIQVEDSENLADLRVFQHADVVHCQGSKQAMAISHIKKRNGLHCKVVVTMHAFRHGTWYRPLYTNLASYRILNQVDILHFVSNKARDEFLSWNLIQKRVNASTVFPLGCNEERYQKVESLADLDFFRQLSQTNNNIVYLADLTPRKRHIWLLDALKDTLRRHDATLWLFGEGDQQVEIEAFIERHGIKNHVVLPGRIDGKYVPSVLREMDVAVCTSSSETMGHLIIEPMFAGLPVVTIDVGIASSVIWDYVTGTVIKNSAEKANFARAVQTLLENPQMARKMGKNAQTFANQWLTWSENAQNCLHMYCRLIHTS